MIEVDDAYHPTTGDQLLTLGLAVGGHLAIIAILITRLARLR